jgi:chromosomal replication initiator protein
LELPAHPELTPAWRKICAELRRVVGESTYELWLAPLEARAWDGRVLSLGVPPDIGPWISGRFKHVIQRSVRAVLGEAARVEFESLHSRPARSQSQPYGEPAPFNPRYSFNQFVIGEGNRLAHAASLAVAELPGQAYNPLFLHAPPGLGKTHLLHAIGNYVRNFGAGTVVRYTTAEAFTNHFLTALGSRSLGHFKQAYRDADILLIDDVQFLASKAKTEEEFFHTFNALYETGRQLVLTCDRLPHQMITVEERLRERFEAGLVAVMAPPDFSTRVTILRKRAALDHITTEDPHVLELIAERITGNVRALEGALIRVVAYHSLTGHPIDCEMTTRVLDAICPTSAPEHASLSLAAIQLAVASHYELSPDDLVSSTRRARVAWARQVAIHLTRQLTHLSLQAIGEGFGGRNHATVLHACKRVGERLVVDDHVASELRELTDGLLSQQADRSC